MPAWRFAPIPEDQVAPDVTQRDQFNNDAVELFQSLVREAIQNSTDQPIGSDPVRLRFAIKVLSVEEAATLKALIAPIRENCEICRLDTRPMDAASPRVLAIEDFNTTGLAGAVDKHDEGQFAGFWRRHGGSSKDASKGGSHGLGKLVFSAASAVGAIFGHTVRADGRSLLLGQAILNNHKLRGQRLPAHGFWTPTQEQGRIQMPTESPALIQKLASLFGFRRTTETGLSIAVPYVAPEVDHNSLIRAVVTNYFFPILSGDLVVEVDQTVISRDTFSDVAKEVPGLSGDELHRLQFVKRLLPHIGNEPQYVLHGDFGGRRLGEDPLPNDVLDGLRKTWSAGEIASVRVPLVVKPRLQADQLTYVDLYLCKKPDGAAPWALFARNSLVVPGESRLSFSEAAFGALIASHPAVCALLRDAEDPAHIRWNAKEKIKKGWRFGPQTVLNVRLSLKALYRDITAELREEHRDLLLDFLSIKDPAAKRGAKTRTPVKPKEPLPIRPKFFREEPIDGGFRIAAGPGASDRQYPVRIRVRAAYDVLSGNPFKLHSEHDFSFRKKHLAVRGHGVRPLETDHAAVVLECETKDFFFEVSGFDANRDLIVEARVSE